MDAKQVHSLLDKRIDEVKEGMEAKVAAVGDQLKDVKSDIHGRIDNHEQHCNERQAIIHGKLDGLTRMVLIGNGIVITLYAVAALWVTFVAG